MGVEEYSAIDTTEYEQDYFTHTGYNGYMDYPHHKIRVEKIIAMTHPKSVLDVGGAYGYIVKHLLDKGIYAICMDISHWAGEQAEKIIPEHFVRHDMRDTPYPFKDKEFDVVYCEGVLEHIEDSAVDRIMAEFERISHKRILALTFDWHVKLRPYSQESELAPGHINLHDQKWWFDKMPKYTWLFIPPTGTQDGNFWYYKC